MEKELDVINKPHHYHKGGIDVLTYVKDKVSQEKMEGFLQINVLKYVTRYEEKGGSEDLEKAMFYLKKLIEIKKGDTQHAVANSKGSVTSDYISKYPFGEETQRITSVMGGTPNR